MPRSLEQRYRSLIRVYPRSYQERRGEEMVATLLECAGPDRTRPTRRDVADVLSGALRERLGVHTLPGFAAGLRIAAPIALVFAAGFATSSWLIGARDLDGSVLAAAWLLAAVVWAAAPRHRLLATALAWLATLVVMLPITPQTVSVLQSGEWFEGRHVSWRPIELFAGLIALVGAATATQRLSFAERLGVPFAVGGLALQTALTFVVNAPTDRAFGVLPDPTWAIALWVLPLLTSMIGAVVALRKGGTGLLWASLILFILVPASPISIDLGYPEWLPMLFVTNLPAPEILLLGLMVAIAVRLRTREVTAGPRAALASAGSISLGTAGGVALCALVTGAPPLIVALPVVAALVAGFVPQLARRLLVGAALLAVVASAGPLGLGGASLSPHVIGALVVLLLVALVTVGEGDRSSTALLLVVAAFAGGAVLLTDDSLYWGRWSLAVAPAVAGAVLVPTVVCAARAVVRRRSAGWAGAVVVFAAGAVWLTILLVPTAGSRLVAAVAATVTLLLVALTLVARLRARSPHPLWNV